MNTNTVTIDNVPSVELYDYLVWRWHRDEKSPEGISYSGGITVYPTGIISTEISQAPSQPKDDLLEGTWDTLISNINNAKSKDGWNPSDVWGKNWTPVSLYPGIEDIIIDIDDMSLSDWEGKLPLLYNLRKNPGFYALLEVKILSDWNKLSGDYVSSETEGYILVYQPFD